jgi:hypothetical protein
VALEQKRQSESGNKQKYIARGCAPAIHSMSKVQVALKPTAGFCIKSATLQPAVLKLASSVPPGPNSLEPQSTSLAVPIQRKVFINIAWDSQVPPPPEGNEEAIQRAMYSEDEHLNPDAWFVPVVVSEARQDTDKCTFMRLFWGPFPPIRSSYCAPQSSA